MGGDSCPGSRCPWGIVVQGLVPRDDCPEVVVLGVVILEPVMCFMNVIFTWLPYICKI